MAAAAAAPANRFLTVKSTMLLSSVTATMLAGLQKDTYTSVCRLYHGLQNGKLSGGCLLRSNIMLKLCWQQQLHMLAPNIPWLATKLATTSKSVSADGDAMLDINSLLRKQTDTFVKCRWTTVGRIWLKYVFAAYFKSFSVGQELSCDRPVDSVLNGSSLRAGRR